MNTLPKGFLPVITGVRVDDDGWFVLDRLGDHGIVTSSRIDLRRPVDALVLDELDLYRSN